jgi:IPT/TIG domain-containing protein/parallel beta helix pectate lyase-like protein
MVLLLALLQALGLVTPAVERWVSDRGDDADDGSKTTPMRTITAAIADGEAARAGGQPLTIHCTGTLREDVLLPSDVTLIGDATLEAATAGAALTITGVSGVEVRGLKIVGRGPYTGDGGAVLVDQAQNVTIELCELSGGVAGRGGGLAVLASNAVRVRSCSVHDNTAGTPATTMAGATLGPVDGIELPTGNGHGGGIFWRDTDGEIAACDVYENEAILAGGGIAVSNVTRFAAPLTIRDCQVTSNQVAHPNLTALRAPMTIARTDVGDPVFAAYDLWGFATDEVNQLVALLHGLTFESGLGGGISLRSVRAATRVEDCRVGITRAGKEGANRARRGGGIHCYSNAYPTIQRNEVANNVAGGDGGGICIDQFDPYLPPGTASRFGINATAMSPRQLIQLTANRVHHNHALEDGGGMYVTGAAQVTVTGGAVEANRAAEDGGGLRATYAANLGVYGTAIRDNQANVVGTERDGGGGVAARNANVTLQNCELSRNICNGFAGGAVYFASAWEGGISGLVIPSRVANAHGLLDEIMEAAFGFRTRVLRIVDCHGDGNQARGVFGAGGFLYAVRSAEPPTAGSADILGGGEAMWVSITGARTSITGTRSDHANAAARKRGSVVVELSGRRVGTTLVPQDRVWIGPELGVDAIEASTTAAPDALVPGRAVVVTLDRDATHDRQLDLWPGGPLAVGPVPTVTAVAPAGAPATGGSALTLTGTGFEAGTTVFVAGVAAPVTAQTPTTLTVTSPAAPVGPADVTVTLPSGAAATLAGALTLSAP